MKITNNGSKLVLNHRFPEIARKDSYVVVPVVTPAGFVKELKIQPGAAPQTWVQCEWEKGNGGRIVGLTAVSLTTEREQAGCVFLQAAYLAEGWEDGWRAYESFMASQYQNEQGRNREKPLTVGHFPDDLLPKAVLAMRGRPVRKAPKWQRPEGLRHPADAVKAEPIEPAVASEPAPKSAKSAKVS